MSIEEPQYPLNDKVLTAQQSRRVDEIAIERFQMDSLVLMENAAANCARWLCTQMQIGTVLILCGRGNNGGDGLAIARHLEVFGWKVICWLLGPTEKLAKDCEANLRILQHSDSNIRVVDDLELPWQNLFDDIAPDMVIDAMLGTGVTGSPRAPFNSWIEVSNNSAAHRVAIDVPTGVDPDSGEIYSAAFSANATVTFVTRKPAMTKTDTKDLFGQISVQPIGIPQMLVSEILDW